MAKPCSYYRSYEALMPPVTSAGRGLYDVMWRAGDVIAYFRCNPAQCGREPGLVVDPPADDGGAVEVDGAGGVVAPVHGDHRDVARHLGNTDTGRALELCSSRSGLFLLRATGVPSSGQTRHQLPPRQRPRAGARRSTLHTHIYCVTHTNMLNNDPILSNTFVEYISVPLNFNYLSFVRWKDL